jgi:hypothetical protein
MALPLPACLLPGLLLQWSSRKPYYSPSPPQSTLGRDPSWPVLGDEEQEDGAGALPALPCYRPCFAPSNCRSWLEVAAYDDLM